MCIDGEQDNVLSLKQVIGMFTAEFGGAHTRLLFKYTAEVQRIGIAYRGSYLRDGAVRAVCKQQAG